MSALDVLFGGPLIWWVGVGSAFLAALLLLSVFLVAPVQTPGARTLKRTLRYTEAVAVKKGRLRRRGSMLGSAADLVGRLPFDEESTHTLQVRLERAGWPLRATEFRVLQVAAAFGTGFLVIVLSTSLLLGVVGGVVGAFLPGVYLTYRVNKRAHAFEAQLPDVLQLLASSLRAGYGFVQAIDTVSREAKDPAAGEFARVVNEARLGGSVEEALGGMAERLQSEDFRWVVIAVNIQRQVGGNLAELLETVAETIRERERLRRHVRALSAEGRLSGWILLALPVLLGAYIMAVNPDYLRIMTGTGGGRIALIVTAMFMGLGALWIRKIVRIEV